MVLLLLLLASAARAQVPLPPDLAIIPPGPEIPAEFARFSGAWGDAAWGGVLPGALVVERIDRTGAVQAIYAVGDSAQFAIAAQWTRVPGTIVAGRLTLQLRGGVAAEFAWSGNELAGQYTGAAGWRSSAWMRRIPGDTAAVAAALARPFKPSWTELRIPVAPAAGGAPVQLQVFRYWPVMPGRRPVIVFNHGSTDGERPGVVSIQPAEAQARLFLSYGWAVLVPMRKGRGLSEGAMQEQSNLSSPSQAQLDSAIEDLDAVIQHLRAQPDVDASKIVVAGQSRGGMLALAYAGRHPGAVAGVLNFSGGWWSERDRTGFNHAQAALAGRRAGVPTLWLYADRDRYYGLPYVRGLFDAFRDTGGQGELLLFHDLPGDGHALVGWTDRWNEPVAAFLARIERGPR